MNIVASKWEELGDGSELKFKNIDECAATHVVAAFDPRLDGMF